MSDQRYAVLIASSRFLEDERASLPSLRCPEADVDGLNDVLDNQDIGAFKTVLLKNEPHYEVMATLSQVLKRAKKQDLVLLYYSGHGLLDESGNLYLATTNTKRELLEATSIPVTDIKRIIDNSPPTKTILILDCCYSGAASGAYFKGAIKETMTQIFPDGKGTCVLTASTDREVAREDAGEKYSLFTEQIITGLKSGDADIDGDGFVTVDDLHNYVREKITKNQTPTKFGSVSGSLVLTKNPKVTARNQTYRIKKLLFDLGQAEVIPDFIIADALKINNLTPTELSEKQRQYRLLLEGLLNGDKKPGDFVAEWTRIGFAAGEADAKPHFQSRTDGELKARLMTGPRIPDSTVWARPIEFLSRKWKRPGMVSWYTPDIISRHVIKSIIQSAVGLGHRDEVNGSATYYDYTTTRHGY